MTIRHFDNENDLEQDFDEFEERMREEVYIKDAIARAHERVAAATDELNEAQEELQDLEQQLNDLGV